MSKEELPVEDADSDSTEGVEETPEEPSVPLSQYEKIKDDHLRLAADFDNYKKRAEKEKENISSVTLAYFINALFPLIDNFEMAMSQDEISKETEAFNSLLQSILENLQLEEVGTVGESFDPSIHEAVEHTGEGDLQVVDAVLRKGYMFQGNLIRPSMVKVKSE
mgnify:FL=1